MNVTEAKRILALYRPGTRDEEDPQIAEALALAKTDPALTRWLEQHCAEHIALRDRLRAAPVPAELRAQILAHRRIVRPRLWRRPEFLLAAAAALAVAALSWRWLQAPPPPDRFADFRGRMVAGVLRSYNMDIQSPDMEQVRAYLKDRGAPADYRITSGLARLKLTGGGRLQWRGHAVSMVCFDRGDAQMLYLFVVPQDAVRDAPASGTVVEKVKRLATVSWVEDGRAYVLAGPEEPDFPSKYR